jgi:hypothetical protein
MKIIVQPCDYCSSQFGKLESNDKTLFVCSSIEQIKDPKEREPLHNWPINLFMCKHFQKSKWKWGVEGNTAYTIVFCLLDNERLTWSFPTEEERDSEFNRILNLGTTR